MTINEVNKELLREFKPIVEPLGFAQKTDAEGILFRKQFEFGFNDIIFQVWMQGDFLLLGMGFLIRIDELNKIFVHFGNYVVHEKDETITISADIQTLGHEERGVKLATRNDVNKALETLKDILVTKGLLFFNTFKSVSAIDAELNRENRPVNLYCDDLMHRPIIGLTAAALTHNPRFAFWEEYYRNQLKNTSKSRRDKYEALATHLRERIL